MGLGEFVSRAVLEFRGDTSQLKGQIKDLQGAEKERAQQLLANIEKENKGYESVAKKLGDLNQALELVGKVTSAVGSAMKEYGDHLRLVAAAGSADIGKLQSAFKGLVNEHDLLTFAAQTQRGVLALNQQEMEKVGQAALAFRNRGFELDEVMKKLTDVTIKGQVDGLKDLGVVVEQGETRAETLKNVMSELDKVIKESGGAYDDAADDIQRLSVGWDDATAAAKRYAAQSVMALGKDITHIFGTDEQLKKQAELIRKGMSQQAAYDLVIGEDTARAQAVRDNIAEANRARGVQADAQRKADMALIEMPEMDVSRKGGPRQSRFSDYATRAGTDTAGKPIGFNGQLFSDAADRARSQSIMRDEYGNPAEATAFAEALKKVNQERLQGLADVAAKEQELYLNREAVKKSALESVFGPLEEFDIYREAFTTMGEVWGGFSNAVAASYEAIVTGQGSVSAAFKKIFADSLMATGKASAVDALRETALGLASLALGPIGGVSASMHFAAAGAHAAVATAAGVAAHALGAGSGSSAAAAGASSGSRPQSGSGSTGASGGGNSAPADTRPIVVIAGSSFDDATPRQKQRYAEDALDRAMRLRDEA